MFQIAIIIGIISLVGCLLLSIIRGSSSDASEETRHIDIAKKRSVVTPSKPPALPIQNVKKGTTHVDVEAYPKCPICRCHNMLGRKQMVFRDGTRWKCVNGHIYDI